MINRLRAAAALLLLLGASCGDSTLPEDRRGVHFRYSGALSGEFSTDDDVVPGSELRCTQMTVEADALQDNGLEQNLYLTLIGTREGTYPLTAGGGVGNAVGSLSVLDAQGSFQVYWFTSGTVEVTELADRRIRGRFRGTLEREGARVQVTDGSFNLYVEDFCID
jgi:hypothetical protein